MVFFSVYLSLILVYLFSLNCDQKTKLLISFFIENLNLMIENTQKKYQFFIIKIRKKSKKT